MRSARRRVPAILVLPLALGMAGCGLVFDAVQALSPLAVVDDLQAVCARGRLQVGMAVEPRRPFIFPATFTDEGPRVTGMDVEFVQEIAADLSRRCGGRLVTPVLHLVHFRELFVLLNEGKLDLFVSALTANVPSPVRAGLAYSNPYFLDGGLSVIARHRETVERVRNRAREAMARRDPPSARLEALGGLTVAVQEGTSGHFFSQEHLQNVRLVLCDSMPATFESAETLGIDVLIGKHPVLDFVAERVRTEWHSLGEPGQPFLLAQEHYAVLLAEESYRLRLIINELIFRLEASGRLPAMRRRWLEEKYAYPRRAATEGLPFAIEQIHKQFAQGDCHVASSK